MNTVSSQIKPTTVSSYEMPYSSNIMRVRVRVRVSRSPSWASMKRMVSGLLATELLRPEGAGL